MANLKKYPLVIGVDEAGRGSWAGPVVAACVAWSGRNPIKSRLGDSKALKKADREKAYDEIMSLVQLGKITVGVGIIDAAQIDAVGIREANRLAMQEALRSMYNEKCITLPTGRQVCNDGILLKIDGRDNYVFDIAGLPEPEYIVRGDSKIKQIMAASIVAKVTRDAIMSDFENQFIGYGFAQHKGYGTALHQSALEKLGICKMHRKSYKPISRILLIERS